jgi:hypothetical protein
LYLDERTKDILNELKKPIASLRSEDIQVWYKFPKPDSPLHEKLMDAFKEEHKDMSKAIQYWSEEGVVQFER